jgi:hypothetical protein
VGRRAHAEVLRPALRASGTGFARRKTRVTRPSEAGAAAALSGADAGAGTGGPSPACSAGLSGAAPELPSGPSRCGAGGRSSGCSAGPVVPSATRTRLPNARGAARCRTHGLRCENAALRVPVPRLRRHVRGQPPDAGCRRPEHLSPGTRRHRQAAVHSRRYRPRWAIGAVRRRRWRLLRRRLRLRMRAARLTRAGTPERWIGSIRVRRNRK